MAAVTLRLDQTGLLVVDPYNNFISEVGKLWSRVREVVEGNRCLHDRDSRSGSFRRCSSLLRAAPSLAPWRLRNVEILGTDPGSLRALESHARDQRPLTMLGLLSQPKN